MAKPELRDHRKFLKLQRLMGEPRPHLMGYLECLWLRGYQTGNPVIGDSLDVESAAEYPGEVGKLTAALLAAGFIDALDGGEFAIHDLYEHAPKYARLRMRRKGTAENDENEAEQNHPEVDESGTSVPCNPENRDTCPPKTRTDNREPRTENPNRETKTSDTPLPPTGGEKDRIVCALAEAAGGLDPKTAGRKLNPAADTLVAAGYSADDVIAYAKANKPEGKRPHFGINEIVTGIGRTRKAKASSRPSFANLRAMTVPELERVCRIWEADATLCRLAREEIARRPP